MANYFETLDKRVLAYFNILESEFPKWLLDYVNTKDILRLNGIGCSCGTIYSNLFESSFNFSTLDHSVGVALIVWHFTHDKKQTLAGLFHDIATPVFKHCIDYLYGDYEKQEATEDLTTTMIKESTEIMNLLKRDNISIDEVDDYHKYTIADNNTPKLSADRLEYSLSNMLFTYEFCDIKLIKDLYEDICVGVNESKEFELCFKSEEKAVKFVELTSKLSLIYRQDTTRYSMQFLADIVKTLHNENVISIEDLYKLSEKEVMDIIENSKYSKIFNIWKNSKHINASINQPNVVYCVKVGSKVRYINPLVRDKRIYEVSTIAKNLIDNNLSYKMDNYVWIDGISF